MYTEKKRDWGVIVAGVLLVICAFVCLLMPGVTLVTITMIAGAGFFIVFGVFEIVMAVRGRSAGMPMWGWAVFSGVVGVLCGLTFFLSPATLSIFIALFMIMRGATLLVFGWNAGRMLV